MDQIFAWMIENIFSENFYFCGRWHFMILLCIIHNENSTCNAFVIHAAYQWNFKSDIWDLSQPNEYKYFYFPCHTQTGSDGRSGFGRLGFGRSGLLLGKPSFWFHTSFLFSKYPSNTLQHPSNTLKTTFNTLQTHFKIIFFSLEKWMKKNK